MVEDVEKFRPHLESNALGNFGLFGQCEIEINPAWPAQDISAGAVTAGDDRVTGRGKVAVEILIAGRAGS